MNMKNMFKKILLSLTMLFVGTSLYAQTLMSSNNMIGTNILLIGRYLVSSVTILCATGANTVLFYDTANTGLTYTNAAYRYQSHVVTNNMPVYFTNGLGNRDTSYYNGIWTYWTTNVANTNAVPAFASIAVEANVPVTLPTSWIIDQGFAINVQGSTGGPGKSQITVLYK